MTPVGAPVHEHTGAEFDGSSDYLRRAEADWRSGDSAGTISAWIKPDVINADQVIFSSADQGGTTRYITFVLRDGTASNRLEVAQRNNDTFDQVRGDTVFAAGRWYHVVLTSVGDAYAVYVDGAAEELTVMNGTNSGDWLADTINRDSVTIGIRRRSDFWGYFNGQIRDVRYYSEAKSASWVKREYQRGVPDDSLLLHVLTGDVDLSRYERVLTRTGGVVVGHDMEFDGTDDLIDCGDLGNIQTIMGWVKPSTTTEEIWLVDAGNDVMVSGGTVTYTGLTPVATYVNGVAGTALAAGVWQHLACVVETVDANNFELGTDGANFGATSQRDVKVFSEAKAADFVRAYYLKTRGFY